MKCLEAFKKTAIEQTSLEEYLKKARGDASLYANAFERMLKAIGAPKKIDTSKDTRLSRVFGNRIINRYETFKDFYGMEDVIERIVSYFKHAAQGLEESRQVLYLLGAVGTAKSSIAERLKSLMEQEPIYVLTSREGELSPIYESPLGLFKEEHSKELKIPERYLKIKMSPWAMKRIDEYDGDITQFKVTKIFPNQYRQQAITKTEPGDENNQDISALVGKLDIRKLEFYSQNDPDAYSYSGGLCLGNQGVLEFVEMFKAPIKVLHPLLTATQEKNYKGTEALSAIPFDGIILAHSNESEWDSFKSNKNNEAFLDRIYIVEVPYCLRVDEEIQIYEKLLKSSSLADAPCAPNTLRLLAEFCVLSRLEDPKVAKITLKMMAYNGENVKEKSNSAKSAQEFKEFASANEGFFGISTRLAYKILSEVYNFDSDEVAADPVHMLYVLEKTVKAERFSREVEERYLSYIKDYLTQEFAKKVGKDIQTAYLDSYDEYGQSLFDRYILFADYWIQDNDYRDPDTGVMFDRKAIDKELSRLEKGVGIANPKDFRHEVVNFALRYQARHDGNNPRWTAYEKLKKVVEATMFEKTQDLLPVISFGGSSNSEDTKKHEAFVERMKGFGYTERQVRRVVEWHTRVTRS